MKGKDLAMYLLTALLVAVIAGGGVYLWQQNEIDDLKEQLSLAESKLAADDDSSTAPSADDSQTSEVVEQDTQPAAKSDDVLITEAMATHMNKTVAETDVTVNENDGTYASGLVKFAGEIAGGWWLAAKTSGSWVIVADGNGTVMCTDIAPYSFPTTMVPECWDEATMTLITR